VPAIDTMYAVRVFFFSIFVNPETDTTTMLGLGSSFIIILHSYTYNNTIFFCNNIQSIIIKAHKTNNGITTQKSKRPMVVGGWGSKNLAKQLYANKALRIARTNSAIWL